VDDYDKYCHYVAGLVGYGLSRLFYAAGTEDLASDQLSNSMGLFLQVLWRFNYFDFHNELIFYIYPIINNWTSITENKYNKGLFGGHK
jgi:hypothetical protein